MKNILKKSAAVIVTVCILLSILTVNVFAAASSSIAFSKNTVTLNETLTVTARFSTSSGDPMYGLEGFVTYNPKVIKFVSGDNCNLLTEGKIKIVLQSAGKINLTETIKFSTVAAGKSSIALEQLVYADDALIQQDMSGSSATVTVTNPSVEASSNANLRKLGVSAGTLSPSFSPDIITYNVTIPYKETELWLQPGLADQKASYVVDGSKDMKVGNNKRVIIVTAENGTTKSYTINITRLDENGKAPSTEIDEPVNDMVEVNVDGEIMYVNENFSTEEIPEGFEIIEYAIGGKSVPAVQSEDFVILNLIKPDGSESGFYTVNADGSYTRLNRLKIGNGIYYILKAKDIPNGYTATTVNIDKEEVVAYSSADAKEKEFVLIYAKGLSGYTGFYRYDTVEGTIQRAPSSFTEIQPPVEEVKEETEKDIIKNFKKLNKTGKIVVFTILGIMILLVIAIIILVVKLISAIVAGAKARKLRKFEEETQEQVGFDYVSLAERDFTSGRNESFETDSDEINVVVTEEVETAEESE